MKLLFVCHYNQMRSRTAECIYNSRYLYHALSAGTASRATRKLTTELIQWAAKIFIMEREQVAFLKKHFPKETKNKVVITLDIPDYYYFMETELVELIQAKVIPYLDR